MRLPWCSGVTQACMTSSRHNNCNIAAFCIKNRHVYQAGAEVEKFEVVADDSCQVLVIAAISVSVKIGRVLATLPIPY